MNMKHASSHFQATPHPAAHLSMTAAEERNRRFAGLSQKRFDVAVIGGGIIGAGILRDAALRGLSAALFEQRDYASGTTSGSSRLIHGGLRYLEMFDFGLVRMDLRERETLLRIAPHLVKPLEFIVPFYGSTLFYRWKMRAGMLLYDVLSYDKSLPNHRILSARETLEAEPTLRAAGLEGAAAYYDAQVELPERLAVENIVDARTHGAEAFNYAEVTGAIHDTGQVAGVRVRDAITGAIVDVHARVVINASGPWFDRVAGLIESHPARRIRATKGAHLACPSATKRAVVLFSEIDRRLFFVIPLLGFAWVSTTDTDFDGDPAQATATRADIDYLMHSAASYIPALRDAPVYWTNAGVRALVMQEGSESSISRVHKIVSTPGLVSVLGGKITGYRAIAEDATDAAARQLGNKAQCLTAKRLLPGPASPRDEQVVHLADYMLRRTALGFSPDQGQSAARETAASLASALGWTQQTMEEEIQCYLSGLSNTYRTGSEG
jgi:glycerol-3-phosphate dehydrogenase